ncbi:phosphoesterase-domain-containing protein [Rhizopus microsporus var. microsporus]|uniref:Phosphoesterase-domain-containing protein n=2 Tax=Rhizopus microsporus TaxID=58291 RepID=A0A2G4SSQ6_RHIZD|nr:phosphoesterase-domain-containing protein [Rhizopus microsporus ATCC 52813]ORE06021.1 phosphoesterase-domain-containing protein [Rhizopus microsporus var. microsporus]PHZ11426.1 phosphoesterase-domain-containing protein [Rhizopus microsporus ATCC 52813]
MRIIHVAAATSLLIASLVDAAPTQKVPGKQLPGLENIKHVVFFMQENRSFDMYYGTMYGVRGFQDPNVGIQDNGLSLFYQPCSASPDIKNGTKYLLPYQLKGERAGCTAGGSNYWEPFHRALNNGKNDNWPDGNSPKSMGYLTRSQIPFHYALADAFTIHDMYFQSVAGPTHPNRVVWMSGTNKDPHGSRVFTNNIDFPPLTWSTYPEMLTKAGITWQVYQGLDNFDCNPMAWFKQWQLLPLGSAEKKKALGKLGLDAFYEAAEKGTLPQFSLIIGPRELSEHPDNTPAAGAWIQQQVVNAVMNGKNWNNTALFINYDESGGFFDHVVPPQAPESEYVKDPLTGKKVPIGFGPRVPMVVISPWTRGGNVFSEVSDHTSALRFLEEWIGKDENGNYIAPAENISKFARQTSSNLVNVFDFDHPDYSIPKFGPVPKPAQVLGLWAPTEMCEAKITAKKTEPPYGKQVVPTVESGSRPIRGKVVLGRKLAFVTEDAKVIHPDSAAKSLQVSNAKIVKRQDGTISFKFSQDSLFFLSETAKKDHFKVHFAGHPDKCLNLKEGSIVLGECNTSWFFELHEGHHHIKHSETEHALSINAERNVVLNPTHGTHFKLHSVTI